MNHVNRITYRNKTERQVRKVEKSYGRRLLTAALSGIWWIDKDGVDTKDVAETMSFDVNGDAALRKKYGISKVPAYKDTASGTAQEKVLKFINALPDDRITVETEETTYPVVGKEPRTEWLYTCDVEAYREWYKVNVGGNTMMGKAPQVWVSEIEGEYAFEVSFDGGGGVGRMPARFLTPVYAEAW